MKKALGKNKSQHPTALSDFVIITDLSSSVIHSCLGMFYLYKLLNPKGLQHQAHGQWEHW
jgi:hypothetical protein